MTYWVMRELSRASFEMLKNELRVLALVGLGVSPLEEGERAVVSNEWASVSDLWKLSALDRALMNP